MNYQNGMRQNNYVIPNKDDLKKTEVVDELGKNHNWKG